MTLPQRIEALMEADKTRTPDNWQQKNDYENSTVIGAIDGPDDGVYHYDVVAECGDGKAGNSDAKFIALSSQTPQLVRELLGVIAVQAAVIDFYGSASDDELASDDGKAALQALNASADLVMMAKKLTTTKGE